MIKNSIFFKTILAVILLIAVWIPFIYYFSVPFVNHHIFELEERAGQTTLQQVYYTLQREYKVMSSVEEDIINAHKKELKNIVLIIDSYIENMHKKVLRGEISMKEAKKKVFEDMRMFKYGQNDYVFAVNYNSFALSHPDPKVNNTDFSKVKDVKGTLVVPPMVSVAREKGEGYHTYWFRRLGETTPAEKLSYARNVPEWDIVIGTGIYVDDIKKEVNRRKEEMITSLRKHLHDIRIGRTGYLYIFDSNFNMIIHPNPNIEKTNFAKLIDPLTNKPIGEELIKAAGENNYRLDYKWDKPSDPGNYIYEKISWIRYLPEYDWYLASSVYKDDLESNGRMLTNRLILAMIIGLMFSLTGGIILVRNFTRPLKQLSDAAQKISRGDLSGKSGIERNDEIGVLANAFDLMVERLKTQIELLEKRVQERTSQLSGRVLELKKRNKDIALLNSTNKMLQACRMESEIYEVLQKIMTEEFPKSPGSLLILKNSAQQLEVVQKWNCTSCHINHQYNFDDCLSLRHGKLYQVTDPQHQMCCTHIETKQIRPYICTPLVAYGETFGIIYIEDPKTEELDEASKANLLHLINTIAEHSALVIASLRLRESLREQSIRDPLTGLYNRRYMNEIFELEKKRAARNGEKIGVIMIDVDNFKTINDTYGHEAGDKVLQQLGTLIKNEVREGDIPCRYGGEEFTVILPNANKETSKKRAEELRKLIEKNLMVKRNGKQLNITVSIGVASYPPKMKEFEQLIELADEALYRAKHNGKNRVETA